MSIPTMSKTAPTKAETAHLDVFAGLTLAQIEVPTTRAQFEAAAADILAARTVGFDTESKPTFAYEFSDKYPLRRIQIKPVDEKRKRLYNHVFRRHYATINANFDIIGTYESKKETYSPKKNYDTFELNRKIKR